MLFASALFHKVSDFVKFRSTVSAYIRNSPFSNLDLPFSMAAILLESLAVIACLTPFDGFLRAELVGDTLLLYAFAMWLNLRRGNTLLDCGCTWGVVRQPVGYSMVIRNIILAFFAMFLAVPSNERSLQLFDLIAIVSGLVLIVLIYSIKDRISMNETIMNGIK